MAGQTFADRYPHDRGTLLWCQLCGAACLAETLDWHQYCPTCVQWWRDNPPPAEPPAGQAARGAAARCAHRRGR